MLQSDGSGQLGDRPPDRRRGSRSRAAAERPVDPADHDGARRAGARRGDATSSPRPGSTATFAAPLRTIGPQGVGRAPPRRAAARARGARRRRSARRCERRGAEPRSSTRERTPSGAGRRSGSPGAAPSPLGGLMAMLAPAAARRAGRLDGRVPRAARARPLRPPAPDDDAPSLVLRRARTSTRSRRRGRSTAATCASSSRCTRWSTRPSGRCPGCASRLVRLATEYVSGVRGRPRRAREQFGALDPSDPSSFERDRRAPRGAARARCSRRARTRSSPQLQALTSVLEGYADVGGRAASASRLIPSFDQIHEAMQRHRVERGEAERFIEELLGLQLDRGHYEQGEAFCRGRDRAGRARRAQPALGGRERCCRRPAELDAPGLWLARIELPEETSP